MKVLVAGARGVLGRELVPMLAARGREVVGMTRTASKQDGLRALGARPVVADALDPDAVAQAVASAEPEVIVHELTALSGKVSLKDARHPERSLGAIMTNRAAYRGDGPSLGRRPRRGGTALRGAEHCGYSIRPRGRAGADRGRSPRSRPAGAAAAGAGGDPPPRAGGDDDRVGRGSRVALRRLLRSGDRVQPDSGCGDGGADPQASLPARPRTVVASGRSSTSKTPRRRPRPRWSAASRVSTTSSSTTRRRCGSGCRCWRARCSRPLLRGRRGGRSRRAGGAAGP
jgi:NAD dependent epimerase/dehydratase family